eukprot:567557_1
MMTFVYVMLPMVLVYMHLNHKIVAIQFSEERKTIFKAILESNEENTVSYMYHGTKHSVISSISQYGFNPWLSTKKHTNYHGLGAYFATKIGTAIAYAKSKNQATVLFCATIMNET